MRLTVDSKIILIDWIELDWSDECKKRGFVNKIHLKHHNVFNSIKIMRFLLILLIQNVIASEEYTNKRRFVIVISFVCMTNFQCMTEKIIA